MADALLQEIARERGERDAKDAERADAWTRAERLAREVELYDVRIAALEKAAQLRPLSRGKFADSAVASRGRQPGAISQVWREILFKVGTIAPEGADAGEIVSVAQPHLPNVRERDVRERMKSYEHHGYVEAAINGWRVTPQAMAKFGAPPNSDEYDTVEDSDD